MGDTAGRIGGLMCLIVMLTADGHSEFLRMVALIIILRPTKTDQRSKVKGVNETAKPKLDTNKKLDGQTD